MSTHHYKTIKHFNDRGHAHALTFSCYKRQPFLSRDRSRAWLVRAINLARKKHEFDLWSYVFMPEHVHLLIFPRLEEYEISDILETIKNSVAKRALNFVRANAPAFLNRMKDRQPNGKICYRFWQRGPGYDRNLMEPATIFGEIDYIHRNPTRRELCVRAVDWPWSSAKEIERPGSGPLRLNLESLPRTPDG